jgi:hypothetical protein
MAAAIAQEQALSALTDYALKITIAAWVTKAARPTSALQHTSAMYLGDKIAMKFRQRHYGLQLNLIEGHRIRFMVRCSQIMRSLAHKVS